MSSVRPFSERLGLRQPCTVAQVASMNDELRNGPWSVLHLQFWQLRVVARASQSCPGARGPDRLRPCVGRETCASTPRLCRPSPVRHQPSPRAAR